MKSAATVRARPAVRPGTGDHSGGEDRERGKGRRERDPSGQSHLAARPQPHVQERERRELREHDPAHRPADRDVPRPHAARPEGRPDDQRSDEGLDPAFELSPRPVEVQFAALSCRSSISRAGTPMRTSRRSTSARSRRSVDEVGSSRRLQISASPRRRSNASTTRPSASKHASSATGFFAPPIAEALEFGLEPKRRERRVVERPDRDEHSLHPPQLLFGAVVALPAADRDEEQRRPGRRRRR